MSILAYILLYTTLPLLILDLFPNRADNSFAEDVIRIVQTPIGLVIVPITILVTFLHEMGHVIMAKYYGVNVPILS